MEKIYHPHDTKPLLQIRATALAAAAEVYAGKAKSGVIHFTDDAVVESALRFEKYLRNGE